MTNRLKLPLGLSAGDCIRFKILPSFDYVWHIEVICKLQKGEVVDIDIHEIVSLYADALKAWGRIYCSDRVWIDGFRWNAQPAEQKKKLKSAEEALKGVEPIFHGSDKEAYDRVIQHISFYKNFHIQRKKLDYSPVYGAVWLILSIIQDHTGKNLGESHRDKDNTYPGADIILDILKIIGCPKDILPSLASIRKLVDIVRDLEIHPHYLLMSNPPKTLSVFGNAHNNIAKYSNG